jgi:VanZ family protein
MLSLPHGRVLLLIGWILVICTIAGSLAPGMPHVHVPQGDKIMHFLGYFGLTLWFAGLYPPRRLWIIALGFFLMGAVLELLQGMLTATRDMDILDLLVNTLAVGAACVLALLGLSQWALRLESWLTRRLARQESQ